MRRLLAPLLLAAAGCVPADEAISLGSVGFTLKGSIAATDGLVTVDQFPDGTFGWVVTFDAVALGFQTVTIGKVDDPDRCSFRGRGETNDVVFDPRAGLVQTFDGIRPTECPDVGLILAPPGASTEIGPGVTSSDLVALASDSAHAFVVATARHGDDAYTVRLVFDSATTSSRFGGCTTSSTKGVVVRADERTRAELEFRPERLFDDGGGSPRFFPFLLADARGDQDGSVTMEEIDMLPLSFLEEGEYALPNHPSRGTFGDYVRALFRFTFAFDASGFCTGNEPGAER